MTMKDLTSWRRATRKIFSMTKEMKGSHSAHRSGSYPDEEDLPYSDEGSHSQRSGSDRND
jgi:hypothetical protein